MHTPYAHTHTHTHAHTLPFCAHTRSLSLVFALHHYKPTPLYVMDEIDAALGEELTLLLWLWYGVCAQVLLIEGGG